VFRSLLERPAADVTSAELQIQIDVWQSKSSGQHAAAYVRPLCKWAVKRGLMIGQFREIEAPLRSEPIKQDRLKGVEIERFVRNLTNEPHDMAAYFMLLTATRRDETVYAKWGEFDLAKKEWTIPGIRRKDTRSVRQRVKGARPAHVVPLSEQAIGVLSALEIGEAEGLVFKGTRGRPLQNWSRWARRFEKRTGLHVNARIFRRTASTIMGDLLYKPHITRAALGHKYLDDPLISGYNQSRYLDGVREALEALSSYLARLRAERALNSK
jgi:integrase